MWSVEKEDEQTLFLQTVGRNEDESTLEPDREENSRHAFYFLLLIFFSVSAFPHRDHALF